jgi:hypothetical protein
VTVPSSLPTSISPLDADQHISLDLGVFLSLATSLASDSLPGYFISKTIISPSSYPTANKYDFTGSRYKPLINFNVVYS